ELFFFRISAFRVFYRNHVFLLFLLLLLLYLHSHLFSFIVFPPLLLIIILFFTVSSLTIFTILFAPSAMEFAAVIFNPESSNICLPLSTFVPSKRTTNGISKSNCFVASIIP